MRKLKKGRILLGMGFSLLFWISKQYTRIIGGIEFEDQLELFQLFWFEDIFVSKMISVSSWFQKKLKSVIKEIIP